MITLDDFTTPGEKPARRPGEFQRRGTDGPPYVTSLTEKKARGGTAADRIAAAEAAGLDLAAAAAEQGVKVSGKLAAQLLGPEPANELYARPSSLGEDIGNSSNLIKWKERQVAQGIALDPAILDRLNDIDPADQNRTLDGIVSHAHDIAGSPIAANRGTFVHLLTEWADAGMTSTPPYCDPAFNLTNKMIDAVAVGWRKLLTDNDMTVLSSEATVVNDEARAAGSLDRHLQCQSPIKFGLDDTAPTIAAGTVIVADIKTSALRPDSNGLPSYWSSYPIQIYTYAAGVAYDPDDDRGSNLGRTPWPYTVSTDHAVIAHLDIPTLLAGAGAVWSLIYVDLAVGKVGLDAVLAAKSYSSTAKTAFAMSPHTTTVGADKVEAVPTDRRKTLENKYLSLNDADRAAFVALGVDIADLDAVAAALASIDPIDQVAPMVKITMPAQVEARPTIAATTDEGVLNDAGRAIVEPLLAKLGGAQKLWLKEMSMDATNAGAGLGLKERASQRRLDIVTAISKYALEYVTPEDSDEARHEADMLFRAVLAVVVGDDIAWSAAFSPGQIIASLNFEAARTMLNVVGLLTSGAAEVGFTDDGRPRITQQPAA